MSLTITNRGSSWTTAAGNKTVTWTTPTVGHMIVVVTGCTNASAPSGPTNVSDDNPDGLGAYTKVVEATGGGTNGTIQIWVRNNKIGSATSTIFTSTISGDTGGGLWVGGVASTQSIREGLAFIVQSKAENSQTESPPSFSFAAACGTGNGGITAILGEDNPPTLTPPTSWPESIDTGYNTPATGICINSRNSTAGDQTLNWSAGALIDHCEVGVELDATLPAAVGSDVPSSRRRMIAALTGR